MVHHSRNKRTISETFAVGDKVLLSTKNLKLKVPSLKFAPRFIGPFVITHVFNPVSFKLELPSDCRVHSTFHKNLLKRYVDPVVPLPDPPSPSVVDGDLEYEVERIIDSRMVRNSLQYLIHWKGFGPEDRSWVSARDVHAPRVVKLFHRNYPSKPSLRSKGPEAPRGGGGTVRTGGRAVDARSMQGTHTAVGNARGVTAARSGLRTH